MKVTFGSANTILTRTAALACTAAALAGCATLEEPAAGPVYFYPERAQTPAQQDRDRYECYRWSIQQAARGSATRPPPSPRVREAMAACMAARGYRVG